MPVTFVVVVLLIGMGGILFLATSSTRCSCCNGGAVAGRQSAAAIRRSRVRMPSRDRIDSRCPARSRSARRGGGTRRGVGCRPRSRRRRARSGSARERVVEADRRGFAEHVDALLQPGAAAREGPGRAPPDRRGSGGSGTRRGAELRVPAPGDDPAHRGDPGAGVVRAIAGPWTRDDEVGAVHVGVCRFGPVHDGASSPRWRSWCASIVVKRSSASTTSAGTARERAGTVGVLRVHPERSEPIVAGCQQLRDRGILGERAARDDRSVGVGRRGRPRGPRRGGSRRSRPARGGLP